MEWALGCSAMDIVAFFVGSVYNVDTEVRNAQLIICLLTCVLVHLCLCKLWLLLCLRIYLHELGLLGSLQGSGSGCGPIGFRVIRQGSPHCGCDSCEFTWNPGSFVFISGLLVLAIEFTCGFTLK